MPVKSHYFCQFCPDQLMKPSTTKTTLEDKISQSMVCSNCKAFYHYTNGSLNWYGMNTSQNKKTYRVEFYCMNDSCKFGLYWYDREDGDALKLILKLNHTPANLTPSNFPERLKTLLTFL
jgi:hypothetical protein